MTAKEAIDKIEAPVGLTSMIGAMKAGDFSSVTDCAQVYSLTQARARFTAIQEAQMKCGSDWAYWGYEGQLAYWSAVVDILEAAEICPNLPDIEPLRGNFVVMDAAAHVKDYGRRVKAAAEQRRQA